MFKTKLCTVLVTAGMVMGMASMAGAVYYGPVITENFNDAADAAAAVVGHSYEWADIARTRIPTNVGLPGKWYPSGLVPTLNNIGAYPTWDNHDDNWAPMLSMVDKLSDWGATTPAAQYWAGNLPARDAPGYPGELRRSVFALGGILAFTEADGTPRPAVTGDVIKGSFLMYKNKSCIFGFGFTDDIAALQAYQASYPLWGGNDYMLDLPTAYTNGQMTPGNIAVAQPFSQNITGQISIGDAGGSRLNAVVDLNLDGWNEFGSASPNTQNGFYPKVADDTGNNGWKIMFEYTVGNSVYDKLQWQQEPGGPIYDVIQGTSATQNPNGPMPVGKIMTSIEGMFITGTSREPAEVWYDEIHVEIVPEPVTMGVLAFGGLLMLVHRRRHA